MEGQQGHSLFYTSKAHAKRCKLVFSKPRKGLRNDNRNVTTPTTIIEVVIKIFKNAKLTPMAKASIFVAMDKISKT